MIQGPFSGVFPILVTPFDESSRVDEESLKSLVEFAIDAGANGLGIALHSEVYKLSESERSSITKTVVDQTRGRVPLVVNTGAESTELALLYSRMAEQNGASALMLCPPALAIGSVEAIGQFYRTIAETINLPLFVQDTPQSPISPSLVLELAGQCETIRYLKAERPPTPTRIAEAVACADGKVDVFGGAAGDYFVEELLRGSKGTMPGCGQTETFVEIWNLYRRGRIEDARSVFFAKVLPVNRFRGMSSAPFHRLDKEILKERRIIESSKVRTPTIELDETILIELKELVEELYN
jgi:4-hydroxy-tetrahydrodipicolinate synthase